MSWVSLAVISQREKLLTLMPSYDWSHRLNISADEEQFSSYLLLSLTFCIFVFYPWNPRATDHLCLSTLASVFCFSHLMELYCICFLTTLACSLKSFHPSHNPGYVALEHWKQGNKLSNQSVRLESRCLILSNFYLQLDKKLLEVFPSRGETLLLWRVFMHSRMKLYEQKFCLAKILTRT